MGFFDECREKIDLKFFDSLKIDQVLVKHLKGIFLFENEDLDFSKFETNPSNIMFMTNILWNAGMIMFQIPLNEDQKSKNFTPDPTKEVALIVAEDVSVNPNVFQTPSNIKIITIADGLFGYFPNNATTSNQLSQVLKYDKDVPLWLTQKPLYLKFLITKSANDQYALYKKTDKGKMLKLSMKDKKLVQEESKDFETEPFIFVGYRNL